MPLQWVIPCALFLFVGRLPGAETIPPVPRDHFNDYASMVSVETARRLDSVLTQFERDTSNQILAVIYPSMQSDSSIEDYTVRTAQAWAVGRKDRKNGAVLFIFKNDRAVYIQVGYGLEGVLPDARCKQIVENEIIPRFRSGDFEGGVVTGVQAILASVRGEYQGTGRAINDAQGSRGAGGLKGWGFMAIVVIIILQSIFGRRRNTLYSRGGRRGMWMFPGSGGGWGGGSGGGGGGSFTGGGGSFGGGGAGGRW